MNIFEQATIQKLRFPSVKGDVTTEQLWDIPLTAINGFCLDSIARGVNTSLKSEAEESFVTTHKKPSTARYELMLEILKHVIAAKQEAEQKRASDAARRQEREKLIAILERKQDAALEGMSTEDIQKRLDELS